MALTRNFKETVQARVTADPAFREALLRESIEAMLSGDVDTGKSILRDYIKATVGFEKLGADTGSSSKSLIRMFGPRGNPQARNLFAVLGHLQKHAGLTLRVTAQPEDGGPGPGPRRRRQQQLPTVPEVPNAETRAAMEEARANGKARAAARAR